MWLIEPLPLVISYSMGVWAARGHDLRAARRSVSWQSVRDPPHRSNPRTLVVADDAHQYEGPGPQHPRRHEGWGWAPSKMGWWLKLRENKAFYWCHLKGRCELAVSGRCQGFESLLQLVDNTCADSFDLFFAPLSSNGDLAIQFMVEFPWAMETQ